MIDDALFVKITIYKGSHADRVIYYRNSLPMKIVSQWRWYFEYIAALVKVKHPRQKVELSIGKQDLKQGCDYVSEKTKALLIHKKAMLKKLSKPIVNDDLFGTRQEDADKKKSKLMNEVAELENGKFNYYVPPTYLNHIKEMI